MRCKALPWKQTESRYGQIAKIVGYGVPGAMVVITGLTLSRLKPLARLNPRALMAIQGTLIGAGALAEVAAITSAVVGVKKQPDATSGDKKTASSSDTSVSITGSSFTSHGKRKLRKTLFTQIRADKPDPESFREICQQLGSEELSKPWGKKIAGRFAKATPVIESIYRLSSKQRAGEDTSLQLGMLTLLLEHGASAAPKHINAEKPIELTVLLLKGDLQDEVVTLLMGVGARFPTWRSDGYSISHAPASELTEQSQNLFEKTLAEDLKLIEAARDGNVEAARALIEAGCNPNIRGNPEENEPSALHIAVLEGRTEIVELLLEYGAEVDTDISAEWPSPLSLAIAPAKPNLEIVKLLLKAGASAVSPGAHGEQPPVLNALSHDESSPVAQLLVNHCREQHLRKLAAYSRADRTEAKDKKLAPKKQQARQKELLEAMRADEPDLEVIRDRARKLGAALDESITIGGESMPPPLILAIQDNLEGVARVLLEEGADPNLRDTDGTSAFHVIVQYCPSFEQMTFAQLLLEHGGRIPSSPLKPLLNPDRVTCSRDLYELIVGQLVVDGNFWNRGVERGDAAVVQRYVDEGLPADLVYFSELGASPTSAIEKACEKGHVEVVRMLLEAGAPVSQGAIDAAASDEIRALLARHKAGGGDGADLYG